MDLAEFLQRAEALFRGPVEQAPRETYLQFSLDIIELCHRQQDLFGMCDSLATVELSETLAASTLAEQNLIKSKALLVIMKEQMQRLDAMNAAHDLRDRGVNDKTSWAMEIFLFIIVWLVTVILVAATCYVVSSVNLSFLFISPSDISGY